jgi:hypothetical protein
MPADGDKPCRYLLVTASFVWVGFIPAHKGSSGEKFGNFWTRHPAFCIQAKKVFLYHIYETKINNIVVTD